MFLDEEWGGATVDETKILKSLVEEEKKREKEEKLAKEKAEKERQEEEKFVQFNQFNIWLFCVK